MISPREDRSMEALLAGRGDAADDALVAVIGELRVLGTAGAPTPSAALTLLLEAGLPAAGPAGSAAPARQRRRRGLRGVVLAVVAAGAVTAAGTAANALPGPAQKATASFLNAVTPFHFPAAQPGRPTGDTSRSRPAPALRAPASAGPGEQERPARPPSRLRVPVDPSGGGDGAHAYESDGTDTAPDLGTGPEQAPVSRTGGQERDEAPGSGAPPPATATRPTSAPAPAGDSEGPAGPTSASSAPEPAGGSDVSSDPTAGSAG